MSTHGSSPRSRHAAREATSRDTHASGGFDPTVGGMPYSVARDGEQSQLPDLAPESVDGTILAPGAVDGSVHIIPETLSLDLFAETIRPPSIVDVLPVLPDASYIEGQLVFLTTDGKLYRNVANTWSSEVDGGDIVAGSILAGTLAVGAVGADEIAAGAITTEKFHVGAKAPGVENSTSEVLIDSTGITILNGKINLLDYAGSSVLSASGFGGSWAEFIHGGVYNGEFSAGNFGTTLTAATEVGDGATLSDYAASLSGDVPHWVLESGNDPGTGWRLSNVGGDTKLQFSHDFGGGVTFGEVWAYQDVPVLAGQEYDLYVETDFEGPVGSWDDFALELNAEIYWRNETHGNISYTTSMGDWASSIQPARGRIHLSVGQAPYNARYARIKFNSIGSISGASGANVGYSEVRSVALRPIIKYSEISVGEWTVLGSSGYHTISHLPGVGPYTGMLDIAGGNGVFIRNQNDASTGSPALVLGNGGIAWTTDYNSPAVSLTYASPYLAFNGGATVRALMTGTNPGTSTSRGSSALEIFQGGGSTSDAYMTFHVGGGYAVHFGLDRSTNDLFVGGWTSGATKNPIYHRGTDAIGGSVRKTSSQAIASSAHTKITAYTSTARGGFGCSWSPYGGSEWRANVAGFYLVQGSVRFSGSAAGSWRILGLTRGSAATPAAGAVSEEYLRTQHYTNNTTTWLNGAWYVYLNVNDTIALSVYQNAGVSVNVDDAQFGLARLGA